MKLLIWLWNPGTRYSQTRHNVGFLCLDFIAERYDFWAFKNEPKFQAEVSEWRLWSEKVILVKPQTFMNLSGDALSKICHFYKIETRDWCVIYDDKDMDFWKLRYRSTGSSGWQNGIKSIISHFWSDFSRLKIGIGNDPRYDTADWVLSKFSSDELSELDTDIFPEAYHRLIEFIENNE